MNHNQPRDPMHEVASWAKDARDEDSQRYFYHFSDVSLIESGIKNYVIGRKGTGKTAIAEYIKLNKGSNRYSRLLSFTNFPFNILYDNKDHQYTSANQYITVWEYVICTSICNMMSDNKNINYDAREKLGRIFDFDIENALPNTIRKITDRGFGVNILGLGANIDGKGSSSSNDLPIYLRKEALSGFISNNIDDSSYYILFDALDDDYKDILQPDRKESYFYLLTSLFKACQNLRFYFKDRVSANIVPVIFLRDEIFDLCRDPDKNKWLDRAISLDWNANRLQNLISFRLSRALDASSQARPFKDIWPLFFRYMEYRGNRSRSEDLFKFMLRSTYNRPRDIINYVRECAGVSMNLGEKLIRNEMIGEADIQQSEYMRKEVIDEIHSVVDDISEIFDLFTEIGKPIFTIREFTWEYDKYRLKQGKKPQLDAETLLKTLYHFSVIGNITSGNRQVFSYNSHAKKLNLNSNVCIHRGLLKALELS